MAPVSTICEDPPITKPLCVPASRWGTPSITPPPVLRLARVGTGHVESQTTSQDNGLDVRQGTVVGSQPVTSPSLSSSRSDMSVSVRLKSWTSTAAEPARWRRHTTTTSINVSRVRKSAPLRVYRGNSAESATAAIRRPTARTHRACRDRQQWNFPESLGAAAVAQALDVTSSSATTSRTVGYRCMADS